MKNCNYPPPKKIFSVLTQMLKNEIILPLVFLERFYVAVFLSRVVSAVAIRSRGF